MSMKASDYKMILWGNTAKGCKIYPLTRREEAIVETKFEYHLNQVMHRSGELNTD